MTGQIVIRSSPVAAYRRQPLLYGTPVSPANSTTTPTRSHRKSSSNVGEVAGGTAANLCVVCCCCPCVVVEFLILAVYKVPATVVRQMWKKRRQMLLIKKNKNKKGIIEYAKDGKVNAAVHLHHHHLHRRHIQEMVVGYVDELSDVELSEFEKVKVSIDGSADAVELDKQMWDRFRDAGFWRSPSQRFD